MIRAIALSLLLVAGAGAQEFRPTLNGNVSMGSVTLNGNVTLYGDASDSLSLRDGTFLQNFYVYNDYVDGSNYSRLKIAGNGIIESQAAGSGTQQSTYLRGAAVRLQTGASNTDALGCFGSTTLFYGNIRPQATATTDIGTSGNQWRNIYLSGGVIFGTGTQLIPNGDGGLIVRDSTLTPTFDVDSSGNGTLAGTLTVGGNFTPDTNNSYYSGTADARWQRTYTNDVLAYNTYTDASNYELGRLYWTSNNLFLRTTGAGTGSQRNIYIDGSSVQFQTGATTRWSINAADLYPAANNTYDIGNTTNYVRNLHLAGEVDFSSGASLGHSSGALTVDGQLRPATDAAENLGGGSFSWLNCYLSSGLFFDNSVRFGLDSTNVLSQRNGTSPQSFRLYNTYTDASNYERAAFYWSGNFAQLVTQAGGTGSPRSLRVGTENVASLFLRTDSTDRWYVAGANGHLVPSADDTYSIGNAAAVVNDIYYGGLLTAYNDYTDGSNYDRVVSFFSGDDFYIRGQAAGTGTLPRVAIDGDVSIMQSNGVSKIMCYTAETVSNQRFRPGADNSYDLGSTSFYWKDIYAKGTVSMDELNLREKSADPGDPAEGESVVWQSDGTGSGDDGDIMVKITAGGVTKTVTLIDFSAF